MATITKRGARRWQVKIRRKGLETVCRTFRAKSEALVWARDIESKIDRGSYLSVVEAEATSLKEALDRYLKEITPGKRGSAQESTRIKKWKTHPLALRSLASLRSVDFAEYRDKRLETVGSNTVRLELAVISHLYRIAKTEWGLENLQNPVANIRKPKLPKRNNRRLVGDEEAQLLSNADPLMRNIIIIAIDTAMRRSEIANLRRKHVDFNKQVIHIPESKNNEERYVPMTMRVKNMLNALPRHIDGTVFGSPDYVKNYISKHFPRICSQARVNNLTFHRLRHEGTSRLFELGLDHMEVSTITGHKTLSMLRHYTHLKSEDLVKKLK